jgi:hypothetical protein
MSFAGPQVHHFMKRNTTMRVTYIFALAAVAAIGGCSSSAGGDDNANSTGCTITLTGASTGSPACTPIGTFWTSDDNMTAFGFVPDLSDPGALVTISFTGQPSTKTYRETDPGTVAAISISSGASQWAMQTASDGTPASGGFTLTITSANTITSAADARTYQLHGTLTATLPAVAGTAATGTVTLKATF